jgi:hypothetical protein
MDLQEDCEEMKRFYAEIVLRRFLRPWVFKRMLFKHGPNWIAFFREREKLRRLNLALMYALLE